MAIIRLRRDTAENWYLVNPILLSGEPGIEINTGWMKMGDGETAWRDLPYFTPKVTVEESNATLAEHVHSPNPHPVYDDGPSLALLYENAKV